MRIDSAAWPFVALAALPAALAALVGSPLVAVTLLLLPIAIALFFRDPDRSPPAAADAVLAPADGVVMHAGPAREGEPPPGQWNQITIFLSVFDVHINRTPVAGRVVRVEQRPGTFRPAFKHDSHRNEQSEIWIDVHGTPVVVRQVVGLLARRVVTRVRAGETLATGARIGLMKFGSRMDVFVPTSATVTCAKGDRVVAGESIIARLAVSA
ncbi:MAG TPA: phosphatidylserine decarboxylase [Vicinamibacterales bacterium]|nr:phosphatidylserine decarboxylase [Vicinamibacterales bacterium]